MKMQAQKNTSVDTGKVVTTYKGTDKEGRMRLGQQYSEQQWQVNEYENGCVLLVPMIPATEKEALEAFDKVFTKHKKTMDALK